MDNALSLFQAQKVIKQCAVTTEQVDESLSRSCGRIAFCSHYCCTPIPSYDQSMYDGYVIASGKNTPIENKHIYEIAGEIAAGDGGRKRLDKGQCYRIMTGAVIPDGGRKVIPQENCRIVDEKLILDDLEAQRDAGYGIGRKGSFYKAGKKIVNAGDCITPAQLGILAESGHDRVSVFSRPNVSLFCSGSELVSKGMPEKTGHKISSNRYLLSALIQRCGAVTHDLGVVEDEVEILEKKFVDASRKKMNLLVSTGGMGPGKYDLVSKAFLNAGGEVFFTSLRLRPGKSLMFGRLGSTLYLGLPGPPYAVNILFHVLIKEVLFVMQGMKKPTMHRFSANLSEDFVRKATEHSLAVEAVMLGKRDGMVRPTGKNEFADCCFILPPLKRKFFRGYSVPVYDYSAFGGISQGTEGGF